MVNFNYSSGRSAGRFHADYNATAWPQLIIWNADQMSWDDKLGPSVAIILEKEYKKVIQFIVMIEIKLQINLRSSYRFKTRFEGVSWFVEIKECSASCHAGRGKAASFWGYISKSFLLCQSILIFKGPCFSYYVREDGHNKWNAIFVLHSYFKLRASPQNLFWDAGRIIDPTKILFDFG